MSRDTYTIRNYAYGPVEQGPYQKLRTAISDAIASAGSVALFNPGVLYSRSIVRDNGTTAAVKRIDVTWNEDTRTLEVIESGWRKLP